MNKKVIICISLLICSVLTLCSCSSLFMPEKDRAKEALYDKYNCEFEILESWKCDSDSFYVYAKDNDGVVCKALIGYDKDFGCLDNYMQEKVGNQISNRLMDSLNHKYFIHAAGEMEFVTEYDVNITPGEYTKNHAGFSICIYANDKVSMQDIVTLQNELHNMGVYQSNSKPSGSIIAYNYTSPEGIEKIKEDYKIHDNLNDDIGWEYLPLENIDKYNY